MEAIIAVIGQFLSWYLPGMLIYYGVMGFIQGIKEADFYVTLKELLLWPVYVSMRIGYVIGYAIINILAHFFG